MEKKRLLPALIIVTLLVPARTGLAEENSLRGIKTVPEKTELFRAKKLLEKLRKPDMAEGEKTLSGIKRNSPDKREEARELLLSEPRPEKTFPEKPRIKKDKDPALFYFFSFSMPRPSLREAANESAAAGAVMVLRGLSRENLKDTALRISEIIEKTGARVWIEPFLFRCFSVESVPQFVLVYGYSPGSECEGLRHIKVSGDVSLPYALELMQKEDENAGIFTRRLKKSGFFHND